MCKESYKHCQFEVILPLIHESYPHTSIEHNIKRASSTRTAESRK